MTHPADADYTALNVPNEAELMAMMDSALVLHETLVRQERRRIPSSAGRFPVEDHPPEAVAIPQIRGRAHRIVLDPPDGPVSYSADIFQEAVAKAEAERGTLSAVDSQMVRQFLSVLDEWMERLRSLTAARENAVMGHALNSIDLGRIGLKKVEGGDDGD